MLSYILNYSIPTNIAYTSSHDSVVGPKEIIFEPFDTIDIYCLTFTNITNTFTILFKLNNIVIL